MPAKDLQAPKSQRVAQRDKESDTETAAELATRRLADRLRQQEHRDRIRSEEGALGLEGFMTERDRFRSQVFGRELARLATQFRGPGRSRAGQSRVLAFRDRCLAGQLLTKYRARRLFALPSLYFLSAEDFKALGVPIEPHTSTVKSPMTVFDKKTLTHEWDLTLVWAGQSVTKKVMWAYSPFEGDSNPPLPSPSPWAQMWNANRAAVRGSVMDELLRLSRDLARAYLWSEDDAAVFVLTGLAPDAAAIRISSEAPESPGDHHQIRLILSVLPWLSAETVQKLYRGFQEFALKRNNRPISEISLHLFDFVSERFHAGESWRVMCDAWNQAHPNHAYDAETVRNFQRDFKQVYKLMVGVDLPRRAAEPTTRTRSLKSVVKSGKEPLAKSQNRGFKANSRRAQ